MSSRARLASRFRQEKHHNPAHSFPNLASLIMLKRIK
jgi:hypothetical protein